MSMSTHVVGFKPADERWHQMKAIWDSCEAAGIEPPESVSAFFDWSDPDPAGVEVAIERTPAVQEYRADMREGFEINIKLLPPDVTIVRVYNSY